MMSEKMGPIISTNGLVFCVDAANPQSIVLGQTIWKDLTFNTTGGTLVNGVGFSGSGINSALSFDGTDDVLIAYADTIHEPRILKQIMKENNNNFCNRDKQTAGKEEI